ncbi:MAG: hypothetical protein HFJ09_05135 [Lachnospiraceae bacterium]|nr:hypothetical protein [Lachnospiraceae bacterium]
MLYIEGNSVYAAGNNETLLLDAFSEEKGVSKFFHKYKFTEKVRYIKKKFACKLKEAVSSENNIRLSDINNRNSVLNNKTKNMVSFASTSASQAKANVCPITNFVKQIGNTCWAATVATIVNYKKNKNITAIDVCNKMGISVSEGGNLYETQAALKSYKLSYHIKTSHLIWSSICKNIDDDKPFCMALETKTKDAHIVTGYGYKSTSTGSKKISVWDSNGYKRIVEYKAGETAITIDGKFFVWLASLY